METTADYVNSVFSAREETAARLLALANGELTNPEDVDSPETPEEYAEAVEVLGGDEWMDTDAASEAIWEFPLAIDRKILVTITLGTGGPSDWIDAECSDYNGSLGIDSATYYASWGSDRREVRLSPSDALWQLAERYIESLEA
jgi:hypothetical protein